MDRKEINDLIDLGKTINLINGLVLVKTLWINSYDLDFVSKYINVPELIRRRAQLPQLVIVLNVGKGYRRFDNDSKVWFDKLDVYPGDIALTEKFTVYEIDTPYGKLNYVPGNKFLCVLEDINLEKLFEFLCV